MFTNTVTKLAKDLVEGDRCVVMGTVVTVGRKSTYVDGGTTIEWVGPTTRSVSFYRDYSTFEMV